MRGESIRLLLRKDIQVIVVLRGNLREKEGIWGGNGGGRKERGRERGSSEEGGRGRGGCNAGGGAEGRCKGKGTPRPVDARVVPGQPRKSQHQLKVTQPGHLKGKIF